MSKMRPNDALADEIFQRHGAGLDGDCGCRFCDGWARELDLAVSIESVTRLAAKAASRLAEYTSRDALDDQRAVILALDVRLALVDVSKRPDMDQSYVISVAAKMDAAMAEVAPLDHVDHRHVAMARCGDVVDPTAWWGVTFRSARNPCGECYHCRRIRAEAARETD